MSENHNRSITNAIIQSAMEVMSASDDHYNYGGWVLWKEDPLVRGNYTPYMSDDAPPELRDEIQKYVKKLKIKDQVDVMHKEARPYTIHKRGGDNMKSILIKRDINFGQYGSHGEREVCISVKFSEEDTETEVIIDTENDYRTIPIPVEVAVQFWKDLQTVNLQLVLEESVKREDAYTYSVYIDYGESTVTLGFWEPDPGDFQNYSKTESHKLITLFQQFLDNLNQMQSSNIFEHK